MTGHVAFLGLGAMGSAMAANLARAGFRVTGFDPDPAAMATAPDGVTRVASLSEAVAGAETVALSLPGPRASREAVTEVLNAGSADIVLDLSTIDPATAGDLAAAVGAHDRVFVHAPVIGGQVGAVAGNLTIIVGGASSAVTRVMPLLKATGTTIHQVDAVRDAALLKLLNNLTSLGNTMVFAEAFGLAAASGLDPAAVFNVLSTGSAASAALERRWKVNIRPDNYRPGFTVRLAVKDLDLALEAAEQLGLRLPAGEATRQVFGELLQDGEGGSDVAVLVRQWQERVSRSIEAAS